MNLVQSGQKLQVSTVCVCVCVCWGEGGGGFLYCPLGSGWSRVVLPVFMCLLPLQPHGQQPHCPPSLPFNRRHYISLGQLCQGYSSLGKVWHSCVML